MDNDGKVTVWNRYPKVTILLITIFNVALDNAVTARFAVGCEFGVSEKWVRIGALEKKSLKTLPEDRQRRC